MLTTGGGSLLTVVTSPVAGSGAVYDLLRGACHTHDRDRLLKQLLCTRYGQRWPERSTHTIGHDSSADQQTGHAISTILSLRQHTAPSARMSDSRGPNWPAHHGSRKDGDSGCPPARLKEGRDGVGSTINERLRVIQNIPDRLNKTRAALTRISDDVKKTHKDTGEPLPGSGSQGRLCDKTCPISLLSDHCHLTSRSHSPANSHTSGREAQSALQSAVYGSGRTRAPLCILIHESNSLSAMYIVYPAYFRSERRQIWTSLPDPQLTRLSKEHSLHGRSAGERQNVGRVPDCYALYMSRRATSGPLTATSGRHTAWAYTRSLQALLAEV